MALITDPDFLSQGTSTTLANLTDIAVTGRTATFTASSGLPTITAGQYFEVRNANTLANNGLYRCTSSSGTSLVAVKQAGSNDETPVADASPGATTVILHTESALSDEKSVYFDFYNREIWLLKQGNLSNDGATLQSIYSFSKEEWKDDADLIFHPFPFVAITPEQFELVEDWKFHDSADTNFTAHEIETRKLVRTGGWREIGADDVIDQEYVGVITLGSFESPDSDLAYFQQGDDPTQTGVATNFKFTGPVNEAIRSYNYMPSSLGTVGLVSGTGEISRTTGTWTGDGYLQGGQITIVTSDTTGLVDTTWYIDSIDTAGTSIFVLDSADGSLTHATTDADDTAFTSAVNNRNVLNVFLRSDFRTDAGQGKTFSSQALADIGVTEVDNKVFRFPISNAADLDLDTVDATVSSTSPYNQISIKYLDTPYSRDVASGVTSEFGILIEVGTYSDNDGSYTSGGTTLTTAGANFTTADSDLYAGGTLIIRNASVGDPDQEFTISTASGSVSGTTVTTTTALPSANDNNRSFTLQRATPVSASTVQIYERIQYELRQDTNLNDYAGTNDVVGRTADELLAFVGADLKGGRDLPVNPNGGGSGVNIIGFRDADTNNIQLFDNTGTERSFPFTASGTISFNANLQNDNQAKFWMFYEYTKETTPAGTVTAGSITDDSVTFTADTPGQFPSVAVDDYIKIQGFSTGSNLNGIYVITADTTDTTEFVARKTNLPDGALTGETSSAGAVSIYQDPIDTPDALIVNGSVGGVAGDIVRDVNGAASVSFTYDYDNEAPAGSYKVAGEDAAVIVRAIGFNTAAFVETTATIARSTANNISLVSSLERNYQNT